MTSLRLSVNTKDNDFIRSLRAIKDEGIRFSMFTTDSVPSPGEILTHPIIVTIASAAAGALVGKIIERWIAKKPTEKIIINNIDLTVNSSLVFNIINNYIQQQIRDKDTGQADKDKFEVIDSGIPEDTK